MYYIALDVGTRKTGIALGDDEIRLARPIGVVSTDTVLSEIDTLFLRRGPCIGFVIGKSESGTTATNAVVRTAEQIAIQLTKKYPGTSIHWQNEFGSSAAVYASLAAGDGRARNATRYRFSSKQNKTIDASAATIILERFFAAHPKNV